MSSESKSHSVVRLQIEMHHLSAFEGDLLVAQTYIPVLNPVTNLNQPQAQQHILYTMLSWKKQV